MRKRSESVPFTELYVNTTMLWAGEGGGLKFRLMNRRKAELRFYVKKNNKVLVYSKYAGLADIVNVQRKL